MKRLPNNYEQVLTGQQSTEGVALSNQEFTSFMSGQTAVMTEVGSAQVKQTFKSQDGKTKLFLAAFAQKGMMRLARLMNALDGVDAELLQPWRVKSMDSEDLISLFKELNNEKTRSLKEVSQIQGLNIDGEAEFEKLVPSKKVEHSDLPAESKARVAKFVRDRLISKDEERKGREA